MGLKQRKYVVGKSGSTHFSAILISVENYGKNPLQFPG